MDKMDEFHRKVQMLLMRKAQEYDELNLLTCRTTDESTRKINDICSCIEEIFRTCDIPSEPGDLASKKECARAYRFLLLNTNFDCLERLAEDQNYGQLVDMCPLLSPYLLIQIVWTLKFEKILARSFLYLPLDLCTELLETTRKCMEELPFERCCDILYEITENVYWNFIHSQKTGVQSSNLKNTLNHLIANYQEFLLLLTNPKVIRLEELPELKKHERYGIIFKRLLGTVKLCFQANVSHAGFYGCEIEDSYNLTFGNEPYVKYDEALLTEAVSRLEHELVNLLLKKIKEIDCNIYFGWAELDDIEKKKKKRKEISLQRSIGNDCYHLLKFMEKDARLCEYSHLVECLQQLASKPDQSKSGFVLSLEELRDCIKEGKNEYVKELMNRYREWDQATLEFVNQNKSLLDKDDCTELLEFLTFVRKRSGKKEWRNFCYNVIMRILFRRSIPEIYEIVMQYITKHNGQNHLELRYTQKCFQEFIRLNSNLRTPSNLRTILLFLLRNPKMVLTSLVKITIGHPDYQNILVSPKDLCLLSPFLSIREENNQILITTVFRQICLENPSWNPTKFLAFIHAILNKRILTVDDLMNNVFISYLEAEDFEVWNLISILANIRFLRWGATKSTSVKRLTIALAKKMTCVRRDNTMSKCKSSEIIHHITKILEHFLETKGSHISNEAKREIMMEVDSIVEPVDKVHFSALSYFTRMGISLVDVIQDYKRRCFVVAEKLKEDPNCPDRLRSQLIDLNFHREDFLRHLISRSTEDEYHQFALEFTTIYCFIFGWNDEIEAYENFLRLTVEACSLLLEHPSLGPRDSAIYLVKCILKFSETFVKIEGLGNPEKVYVALVKSLTSLESPVKQSPYSGFFDALFAHLNRNTQQTPSPQILQEMSSMLDSFLQQCSKPKQGQAAAHSSESPSSSEAPPRTRRYLEAFQAISACIKVPTIEANECIRRMDELFASS